MDAKTERKQRKAVNVELQKITAGYHDSLLLTEISDILVNHQFKALEPAIYCGRDGRSTEQVGERTFFTITWHKMESGRWEVVAYVAQ